MPTKTILHVIDTTGPGGAETVFTQLAAETSRRGFKSIALIRGKGWVSAELERIGVEYLIEDCKGSFNFKFLWRLIQLIRTRKVSLIQSHLFGSNVYTCLAGFICSVQVVVSFHGFVDISKSERFLKAKLSAINLGSVKIVAVTNQIANMLKQYRTIKKDKVVVIANGVDVDAFGVSQGQRIQGKVKIGALGNIRFAKNYHLAIRVIARLVSKGYDVEFSVAGDDKNKLADECRQLASELGIADRIQWLGFCSDAPKYLQSLDIFLLTSSSEGHPLALTQAMSTGLPIVVTRCGVEDVVEDTVSALVASNNDEEDLVRKLEYLIVDTGAATRLGVAARTQCVQEWSLSKTFNAYMELYVAYSK